MAFLDETGLAELWTLIKAEDAKNAKIAVGSYTGTGTYGVNSPNVVTLGFKPKVFIFPANSPTMLSTSAQNCVWYYAGVDAVNTTIFSRPSSGSQNYNFPLHIDFMDDGISWYCYSNYMGVMPDAYTQQNQSGTVYPYIAIG